MSCSCTSHSRSVSSSTLRTKASDKDEQLGKNHNKILLMIMQLLSTKVLAVLASQTLEAAARLRDGMDLIPLDYKQRWVDQLIEAQKVDLIKALNAGWNSGGVYFPSSQAPATPDSNIIQVTGANDRFFYPLRMLPLPCPPSIYALLKYLRALFSGSGPHQYPLCRLCRSGAGCLPLPIIRPGDA